VVWYDVDSFTGVTEQTGFKPEYIWYRIGVKTGGYTSGTANVRIDQTDSNQQDITMKNGKKGKMPAIMIAIAMPGKKPKSKAEMKKEKMEDKVEMAAMKAYAKKKKGK